MSRKLMAAVCVSALTMGAGLRVAAGSGLFDKLKDKAKEAAERKATEVAKEKISEMIGSKKLPDPPAEPEDPFMGEYAGSCASDGKSCDAEAKVVGYLNGKTKEWHWDATLTAKCGAAAKLTGKKAGEKVELSGAGASGQIADGKLTAKAGSASFELKKRVRQSPMLGAKPPAGAIVLLPFEEGKPTNLDEWTNQKWVLMSDGSAMVKGGNSLTKRKFSDCKLHVEFYCPYMPDRTGQGRANSGCYLHSKYEVQVLDSFGLAGKNNEAGGIYTVSDPRVNAALPPGQWQTYDITFRGPRLGPDGAVKDWPKFIEVLHNGVKVQENVEVRKITTAGKGKDHVEAAEIMLQDHGNPVRYRNIWLVERKGQ